MYKNLITIMAALVIAALSSCTNNTNMETKDTKTLVLYYSQTGATKTVAMELQKYLGADIDSIEAVEPYAGTFEETILRCQKEMEAGTLPELKPIATDISKYDTIYLGYPVWFGTYARPMMAFVKQAKLDGKVIIPFCTFGSGGLNTTSEALKADLPNATVLPGYGVRNARLSAVSKELDRFLKENHYIAGEVAPLPAFSEQKPVTDAEVEIFNQACGNYQFPLGTPLTVGSRQAENGTEYEFHVACKSMDGKEDATSVIYILVEEGQKTVFTQVVR